MFSSKIKYLPKRPGERYASALTKMNLTNKVHKKFGKIKLVDYIQDFLSQWYLYNYFFLCIKRHIMKVASSLKSLKKRDLNNKLVKRKGKLYVINKKNPRMKSRQG